MTATIDRLADLVRQEYAAADKERRPRPGRPALIEKLANPPEVSGHQVRKAKELVDAEDASTPADASYKPLSHQAASPPPAGRQEPASRPLVLWPLDATQRLADTNARLASTLATAAAPGPPADRQPTPGRAPRPWPLALIGLAAAVAVWSGWVGLGEMAGFGPVNLLPGIGKGFTINSAVVLPLSVEAYAAYALRVWLATSWHSEQTIAFARRSTITSLVVGGAAQVVYHLLAAAGWSQAPWPVTMLVSLVPVLVLGLASALAKLVANDRQAGGQ